METHDISHAATLKAMRVLTLCSLGATDAQLSYQRIASALEIPEEEVELWVVEAIGQGLLEGCMDQFNSVVNIRYGSTLY